jgi:hypothetical protein
MGDIADLMVNGDICEGCGEEIGPGDGFPRRCTACGGGATERHHGGMRTSKAQRVEDAVATLKKRGIEYETANGGVHCVIRHAGKVVDFWPTTGRYIVRDATTGNGRGLDKLLQVLGSRP